MKRMTDRGGYPAAAGCVTQRPGSGGDVWGEGPWPCTRCIFPPGVLTWCMEPHLPAALATGGGLAHGSVGPIACQE